MAYLLGATHRYARTSASNRVAFGRRGGAASDLGHRRLDVGFANVAGRGASDRRRNRAGYRRHPFAFSAA